MTWFCSVKAVDRGLRVPVGAIELSVDPAVAAQVLQRKPHLQERDLVSFAHLTLAELVMVTTRDEHDVREARAELDELVASTKARDILWLLYFERV